MLLKVHGVEHAAQWTPIISSLAYKAACLLSPTLLSDAGSLDPRDYVKAGPPLSGRPQKGPLDGCLYLDQDADSFFEPPCDSNIPDSDALCSQSCLVTFNVLIP